MYHTNASIMQHFISKFIKSTTTSIPSCRNNHAKISWVEYLGLLHKFMINSDCIVFFLNTNVYLVWRITYNYIELHIFLKYFFNRFVDKRISIGFNGFYTVVLGTVGATMLTLAVLPSVLASHIAQIALFVLESRTNTVFAICLLGAIKRAAAHLGGKVGTSDAEYLFCHNVVYALLQVGYLLFEARQQSFGNLAQEDTALAARVEKSRFAGTEQLLWKQVEHSVSQFGRREDFITAQIGQAVENIRTIVVLHNDKVGCNAMEDRFALAHQSSALRPAHRRGCTGGFV